MYATRISWVNLTLERSKFNDLPFFKRLVLYATHPRYTMLYGVSLLWAGYFLWMNDWVLALASVVAGRIISYASVWSEDPTRWVSTPLGKLILLHLHPANMALHLVSAILLAYGLWAHSGALILGGLSVAVLGHLWGWNSFTTTLIEE